MYLLYICRLRTMRPYLHLAVGTWSAQNADPDLYASHLSCMKAYGLFIPKHVTTNPRYNPFQTTLIMLQVGIRLLMNKRKFLLSQSGVLPLSRLLLFTTAWHGWASTVDSTQSTRVGRHGRSRNHFSQTDMNTQWPRKTIAKSFNQPLTADWLRCTTIDNRRIPQSPLWGVIIPSGGGAAARFQEWYKQTSMPQNWEDNAWS